MIFRRRKQLPPPPPPPVDTRDCENGYVTIDYYHWSERERAKDNRVFVGSVFPYLAVIKVYGPDDKLIGALTDYGVPVLPINSHSSWERIGDKSPDRLEEGIRNAIQAYKATSAYVPSGQRRECL